MKYKSNNEYSETGSYNTNIKQMSETTKKNRTYNNKVTWKYDNDTENSEKGKKEKIGKKIELNYIINIQDKLKAKNDIDEINEKSREWGDSNEVDEMTSQDSKNSCEDFIYIVK